MISADILLKGLGGVAVVGGATGMGVCYQQKLWIFAEGENLKSMGEKVGLVCNATNGQKEETGVECTIGDSGLSVKQGETTKETGKKKDTAQTGTPAGKIKGYKDGNGFKFVIEEGDIALKEGTQTNISKLEQFETYEIEEDGGDKKQYLTRKTEAKEGIKKALGLDDCTFPSGDDGCALDDAKFKKIKFEGGSEGRKAPPANTKLKISKVEGDGSSDYGPFGYKFVLESEQDATITTSVTIKGKTNTEFKIKREAGTNNISLEKAWTVKSLGEKVGLGCPETVNSGTPGDCSLNNAKINVKNGTEESKKFSGLSKKTDAEDKKVKVEVDQEGYNQGFKFYVDGTADIELQNGTGASGTSEDDKKILKKNGAGGSGEVTYEIKKDTDGKWYLTKKTPAVAG